MGPRYSGGAYYPTSVIPSWLHSLSSVMPVTYGLLPLRRILLDGAPLATVVDDVSALVLFAIGITAISVVAVWAAMAYTRRAGTLSQY